MDTKEISLIVEAVIFASEEPLDISKLCEVVECDETQLDEAINRLREKYDQSFSIALVEVGSGFLLVTRPEYAEYVKRLQQSKNYRLSKASVETLAIIAYKQPITRVEIEEIRGTKSDKVLANLVSRNLVVELGRKDTIGRPILYGTSKDFLIHFGLKDLSELPRPEALRM